MTIFGFEMNFNASTWFDYLEIILIVLFVWAAFGVLIWWLISMGWKDDTASEEEPDSPEVSEEETLDVVEASDELDRDDLTAFEGIDSNIAHQLNTEGIYRFEQIDQLSPEEKNRLGLWHVALPAGGLAAWAVGQKAEKKISFDEASEDLPPAREKSASSESLSQESECDILLADLEMADDQPPTSAGPIAESSNALGKNRSGLAFRPFTDGHSITGKLSRSDLEPTTTGSVHRPSTRLDASLATPALGLGMAAITGKVLPFRQENFYATEPTANTAMDSAKDTHVFVNQFTNLDDDIASELTRAGISTQAELDALAPSEKLSLFSALGLPAATLGIGIAASEGSKARELISESVSESEPTVDTHHASHTLGHAGGYVFDSGDRDYANDQQSEVPDQREFHFDSSNRDYRNDSAPKEGQSDSIYEFSKNSKHDIGGFKQLIVGAGAAATGALVGSRLKDKDPQEEKTPPASPGFSFESDRDYTNSLTGTSGSTFCFESEDKNYSNSQPSSPDPQTFEFRPPASSDNLPVEGTVESPAVETSSIETFQTPQDTDDLTELEGIGVVAEQKMNQMGIYRFDQLATLDSSARKKLGASLGIPLLAWGAWQTHWKKHGVRELSPDAITTSNDATKPAPSVMPEPKRGALLQSAIASVTAQSKTTDTAALTPSTEKEVAFDAPISWPIVPTESQVRQRAIELSEWRSIRSLAATADEDWRLAERELYVEACGHGIKVDRQSFYLGDNFPYPVSTVPIAAAEELSRLGYSSPHTLRYLSKDDRTRIDRWFDARGFAPLPQQFDVDEEDWPEVPTHAEIGTRAHQLSQWRAARGIHASEAQDWQLAERELYTAACQLSSRPNRLNFYSNLDRTEPIPGFDTRIGEELGRLGVPNVGALNRLSADEHRKINRWFHARGFFEV